MIIYKITNKVNGKVYIGQTIRSIRERWYGHCNAPTDMAIHKAIEKYGKENFTIEQIDSANDRDELDRKEIYWIKFYNSISPNGYNVTTGGVHYEVTEETRKKLRQYCGEKHHQYGKPLTEETKEKLRYAFLGEKNHFYGKHHTEETKEKLRKINSGKKKSEETIEKLRLLNTGSNNPFYGKKHSEESKRKMSDYRKSVEGENNPKNRKVFLVELGIVFYSSIDAQNQLGICNSLISRCCNGKLSNASGFHFRWLEDII